MKTAIFRVKLFLLIAILVCGTILFTGCKEEARLSSGAEVDAFSNAGPFSPQVDIDKLLVAKNNHGVYTVGKGDILELQMPAILTAISPKVYANQQQQIQPYFCRVSDNGTITLPIIGQMNVEGKTQAKIEEEIFNAYYPKYLVVQPSVVCNIKEYYVRSVTVVGAVVQPGVYQLKSNEMSLVSALMKAGGIVEGGASLIIIKNPMRKYGSSQPTASNQITQFAEFANTEFSNLEVELVFKPDKKNPSTGTLIIQRGKDVIHSKQINTQNSDEIAAYVKELQKIVGAKQAKIIRQAIEQLAGQLAPAITANQATEPTTKKSAENEAGREELLATANDLETTNVNKEIGEIKQTETLPDNAAPIIENPVNTDINNNANVVEEKPEPQIAKASQDLKLQETVEIEKNIEEKSDKPLYAKNEKPKADETAAFKNAEPEIQEGDKVKLSQPPKPQVVPGIDSSEAIILPVKGLNIPFADAPLVEGDLIEVRRLNPAIITVIGLAKNPGAYPYPPDAEYNLMQAIGFAGGIDLIADPRFVTVYRQNASGEIVSAVFRIDSKFMAKSCNVKMKPGDVVSIDVTPRTKRNVLLHQILRLNFGLYVSPKLLGD